jgi:uncharacterized membrane protein
VAVLLGVLTLGAALRFTGIGTEPFWLDEVLTVTYSQGTVGRIVLTNAHDIHPPGYYLGLSAWRAAVGDSEVAMRSYSAAWSLLGLVAIVLLGFELGGLGAGAVAGLLVAVNPLDIFYAQETRMYAQLAALWSWGAWFLWRWLAAGRAGSRERRSVWAAGWLLCCLAMLYTHYLGGLLAVAQGLFALAALLRRRRWHDLLLLCAGVVACVLAFVPWFALVVRLRGSLYSAGHVGWIAAPSIDSMTLELMRVLFRGLAPASGPLARWLLAVLGAAVLGAAALTGLRQSRSEGGSAVARGGRTFSLWLFVVPLLLAVGVSLAWHPIYFPLRFAVLLAGPFALVAGVACAGMPRAAAVVCCLVLAGPMVAATVRQGQITNKAGMRGFARLWRQAGPADLVAFFPVHQAQVASYEVGGPLPEADRQDVEAGLRAGRPLRIWLSVQQGYGARASPGERAFAEWILGLGAVELVGRTEDVEVFSVTVHPSSTQPPSP